MAKIYSHASPKHNNLQPKDETVRFILNYSKALNLIDYNNLDFEALLN